MALGCNGHMVFARGAQSFGQTAFNSTIPVTIQSNFNQTNRIRNLTAGEGITSDLVGLPSGYRTGSAWMMPQKAGALASRNIAGLTVTPTATIYGGITADAPASMTFTVADAAGQLISSGTGTASLTIAIADALLTASLNGTGEAALTITTNTPLLGAEASATATASFTITGALTPYALGAMSGSTVDTTVLTVDAIAAGVLAAALTSPIAADIRKVNDYAVDGNGQSGTEWGPA